MVERELQAILDYSQRPDGASPEWQGKAGIMTAMAVLSPDEVADLKEKWIALIAPYTAAARAGDPRSGPRHVRYFMAPARRRATDPPIQVHRYDEHTVILRQSKSVHYEAPFIYLLFGNDRALLLDTGATADPAKFPLRATVDQLVDEWLARHPRDGYQLVVMHTHGHGDHVAGDAQFAGRAATTVVSRELDVVKEHFGFTAWPEQVAPYDLGGRVLEVTGSPGRLPHRDDQAAWP